MSETKQKQLTSGDVFEHNGKTFKFDVHPDYDMGEPWIEHDGHGVISEWTTRDAEQSERVLCSDRGRNRYYDLAATLEIATRDGWGPTPIVAIEEDFKHLQAWCDNKWGWVGVAVTLLKVDEDAPDGYPPQRRDVLGLKISPIQVII